MSNTVHRYVLVGATTSWLALVAVGQSALVQYALTPGREGMAPVAWPAVTRFDRAPDRYTLVVAVHPHCPCTRATLAELATVMSRCAGHLTARVLFVQPPGFTEDWVKTDLWQTTTAIPGAEAILDPGGREAQRFGAFTSGQVALYDAGGHLAFRGGLTIARGEVGSSAGQSAIVARVGHQSPTAAWTPVYGCPLKEPAAAKQTTGRKDSSCPGK